MVNNGVIHIVQSGCHEINNSGTTKKGLEFIGILVGSCTTELDSNSSGINELPVLNSNNDTNTLPSSSEHDIMEFDLNDIANKSLSYFETTIAKISKPSWFDRSKHTVKTTIANIPWLSGLKGRNSVKSEKYIRMAEAMKTLNILIKKNKQIKTWSECVQRQFDIDWYITNGTDLSEAQRKELLEVHICQLKNLVSDADEIIKCMNVFTDFHLQALQLTAELMGCIEGTTMFEVVEGEEFTRMSINLKAGTQKEKADRIEKAFGGGLSEYKAEQINQLKEILRVKETVMKYLEHIRDIYQKFHSQDWLTQNDKDVLVELLNLIGKIQIPNSQSDPIVTQQHEKGTTVLKQNFQNSDQNADTVSL